MARLTRMTKLLSLVVATGLSLCAQTSPWDACFKVFGGRADGAVKNDLGMGNNFGAGAEVTYSLKKDTALVFDLGYRFFPGSTSVVSDIPKTVAATGVNPTYYETRLRKTAVEGFQASALFRQDAFTEGMYWQAGLRMGLNRAKLTDTGTRMSTDGTAIADMGSVSNTHILTVNTIADVKEKKTVAIGLLAGLGMRFNDRFSGEVNVFQTKAESTAVGKKSGLVAEIAVGVRF